GTNRFSVRAQDNGTPPLMTEQSFTVYVLPADQNKDLIWLAIVHTPTGVRLSWDGTAGHTYRVEYIGHLSETNWTPLGTNQVTTDGRVGMDDNIGAGVQRFYRVVQMN